MYHRLWNALAAAVLAASIDSAAACDDAKYPDLQGHWAHFVVRGLPGQPSSDQTKPWGAGQQAPLTQTVDESYVRARNPQQQWPKYVCGEGNLQVFVGHQQRGRIVDGNSQKPTAGGSAAFPAQVRR
jgi:hypothetical protein